MIKLPVIVSLDEQSDQEIEQGRTWAVVDPDGNEICSGILLYDEAVEMARNTNRYPEALRLLEEIQQDPNYEYLHPCRKEKVEAFIAKEDV